MMYRVSLIGLFILVLAGCSSSGRMLIHESKATYPGHGDTEMSESATAIVELGKVDFAEISGPLLNDKILIGHTKEKKTDFDAISLLPGSYTIRFAKYCSYQDCMFWACGPKYTGTTNYTMPLYVEAGHTYRLRMDLLWFLPLQHRGSHLGHTIGCQRIQTHVWIDDITNGERIGPRCLSKKGESVSRVHALADKGDIEAQKQIAVWAEIGVCQE